MRKRPDIRAHFWRGRVRFYPATWGDLRLQLTEWWKERYILQAFSYIPPYNLSSMKYQDAFLAEVQRIEELPKPKNVSQQGWDQYVESLIANIDVGDVKATVWDYFVNWLHKFYIVNLIEDMLIAWVIGIPEEDYGPPLDYIWR